MKIFISPSTIEFDETNLIENMQHMLDCLLQHKYYLLFLKYEWVLNYVLITCECGHHYI